MSPRDSDFTAVLTAQGTRARACAHLAARARAPHARIIPLAENRGIRIGATTKLRWEKKKTATPRFRIIYFHETSFSDCRIYYILLDIGFY